MNLTPRSPTESTVIMTELVLPQHTNALGTIFGGVVMSWIDIAAAIASGKFEVVSIAPLLAEAIKRIHGNDSVSSLFD